MTGDVEIVTLAARPRREEVRRFLGYPAGHRAHFRTVAALDVALEESRHLVTGRGLLRTLPADAAVGLGLRPVPGASLALGLVTIGPALEARATELQRRGDAAAALILDAVGSSAVEAAADEACLRLLGDGPARDAAEVPCRFSPGYGDWPIEAQREVFEALPAERIGVALTPSCLMVPRKSVSFALWIGGDPSAPRPRGGCASCEHETCLSRRTGG